MLFIGNLPSYAMKIIVNDDKDRIVYSRSSFPGEETYTEYTNENENTNTTTPVTYKRTNLTESQLYYLSNEIRDELIGTYWNYNEENNTAEEINNNENNVNTAVYTYNKRGSREAADYYMVDSIKAPNMLIPSGFPQ